jgi:hypothetical protein
MKILVYFSHISIHNGTSQHLFVDISICSSICHDILIAMIII